MSKKSELKRQISDLEKEIEALEKKRQRSLSVLMVNMLAKKTPNPEDEEYFRVFTALIDENREKLRVLYAQLNDLK